jgi:hypothetical protein
LENHKKAQFDEKKEKRNGIIGSAAHEILKTKNSKNAVDTNNLEDFNQFFKKPAHLRLNTDEKGLWKP